MKKSIIIFGLLLLVVGGSWFGYHHLQKSQKQRDVVSILPTDFVYMLKTKELTKAWKEVSGTNIWQHFIKTKDFEYLQPVDSLLNDALLQNKTTEYIFKNRPTLMAAYLTGNQNYDFVYVIDLKNTKYIKQILDGLIRLNKSYQLKNFKYKGIKIIKLTDKTDPDNVFFVSAIDNLLIVTFSYPLLQKIINEKENTHIITQKSYQIISSRLEGNLIQFYFNYKQLADFAGVFLTDVNKDIQQLSQQLKMSGFDISHESERILMEGFTLTDSIPSYWNALLDVKPGRIKSYNIVSQRAAVHFSLGFKNFNLFYQSLLEQYAAQDQQKRENYRKQLKKVENFFKIDLQKDLFDWIGQEISMVKISTFDKQKPEEVLMLIEAQDITAAQEGLLHIANQIRKRSPFKFKSYTYKNFAINYIHQKRFFKVVLGDLFDKIDKPYYTFIENYVVFSNGEKALKDFIDDYITGKTLSHDADFNDFKDDLHNKANVYLYVQMPKLYNLLVKSLTPETKQSLQERKDLILSFSRIGLQMTTKEDLFKTLLVIDHDEKALAKEKANQMAQQVDQSIHNTYFEDLEFRIYFPDSIPVTDGKYRRYYKDGRTVAAEGLVKDNLPQGIWRTYYPSGNLESVVNYENGDVTGDLFYYFDKKPEQLMVETFYKNNLIDGLYLEYWPNGAQKAKLQYKDGLLNGDAFYYFQTGKLKIKGKFKKGKKKGKWTFYDEKGNVIAKKRYSGLLF